MAWLDRPSRSRSPFLFLPLPLFLPRPPSHASRSAPPSFSGLNLPHCLFRGRECKETFRSKVGRNCLSYRACVACSEPLMTGNAFPAEIYQLPPWPNGQGVGLLIRRLRVRVPQGVYYIVSNFVTRDNCPPLASRSLGCKATPRGFEPLRAEPNGFRVHLLNHSDTVSLQFPHGWIHVHLLNHGFHVSPTLPYCMDTLGIEPRASRMLSGCDTATPCAQMALKASVNVVLGEPCRSPPFVDLCVWNEAF